MGLQILVAVALTLWGTIGVFLAPPIVIERDTTAEHPNWIAYAFTPDQGRDDCLIRVVTMNFDQLPPDYQQLIIDHEVGHCIGLEEIEGPGIMHRHVPPWDGLTEYDVAEFYRVHPPVLPYRAFVSVAHD